MAEDVTHAPAPPAPPTVSTPPASEAWETGRWAGRPLPSGEPVPGGVGPPLGSATPSLWRELPGAVADELRESSTAALRRIGPPQRWPARLRAATAQAAARTAALPGMRVVPVAAEVLAAFGAAILVVQFAGTVLIDPLDRISQVSALAALDLRVVVVGIVIVAACALATRLRRPTFTLRVAAAATAGLATGLAGAGIALALRGTDWPLFATGGDSGALVTWADTLLDGRPIPVAYPPGVIHLIAWTAQLTGTSTIDALQSIHIVGTAVFGPLAYLAWRLVLSPLWALAVTLVAAVPMLEPYKPYTTVVLVVLVPVLVWFLTVLAGAGRARPWRLVGTGLVAGAALGVLALLYTGWFLWSLPGAVAAYLLAFPWRGGVGRGLLLSVAAGAALAAVAGTHLVAIVTAAGSTQDYFFYFDTYVDPAYIAMWRNDFGADGAWPPPGELAGVGVFTFLLAAGLAAALGFGGRRVPVQAVVLLMAGSWVLRLWLASRMYETQTVQLYPRTTAQILFCLLVLAVLAARYGGEWAAEASRRAATRLPRERLRLLPVGVLAGALLLALSMGSSIADRHMPRAENGPGMLAYVSQMVRQQDGTCSEYSRGACLNSGGAVLARIPDQPVPRDRIIG